MYSQASLFNTIFYKDTSAKNYINLVTSTGVQDEFIISKRMEIRRIMLNIATTVATSTANPVLTIRQRPTPGSATNQVTLGTITVPTGTAAPKVLYKEITPIVLQPGQSIAIDLTTQGTDASSAAGTGYFSFEVHPVAEDARVEANMLLSA